MTVIHISFDHPDLIDNRKTNAVKNLISSQNVSDNIVFSLNRTVFKLNKLKAQKEPQGFSLNIIGLPYGILLFLWMYIAYKRIAKIIIREGIKPTLIHGHKLTFEGIIAFYLSRKLGVPYILTFRGDSDLKLLHYKPMYRSLYNRVMLNAEKSIFLAPWAIIQALKYFGKKMCPEKYVIIPSIISIDLQHNIQKNKIKRFLTAFYFENYKRKNVIRVIKAFDRIFTKYPEYGLDIVGGGPNRNKIISCINKTHHPEKFFLPGEMNNKDLLKIYSRYQGFILPSFPETFGLVFIEALAAGTPIIYSKNSGIDGYFNDFNIGIGVNHKSVNEIAAAIEEIILNNIGFAKNVETLISGGILNQFSKSRVGEKYSEIITQHSIRN